MNKLWPFTTPGLPDNQFIRNQVPMTKEEIRVFTLAKARLGPEQIVWDIGSGTGSISIEAAMFVPGGKVYAVERNPQGVELIEQNIKKFNIDNLIPIPGEAPEVLKGLPNPDRVIVGGSGGNLSLILSLVLEKLNNQGRVIINTVAIETVNHCFNALTTIDYELTQVNISRATPCGKYHIWKPLNPVYIFVVQKN